MEVIKLNTKILSNEQELQLVQDYLNGESVSILQNKYGYKTKKSILDKVKKHLGRALTEEEKKEISVKRKGYSVNFSKINNPFNAYFIGLMLTDGYISDDYKFGIDLTDEDAIAFISQITGQKYSYCQSNNINKKNRYRIIFSDKEQVQVLRRYGIVKNKTHILSGFDFLEEEEPYLPFLLRGIIDGDGCIYSTSYGKPAFFIITASKEFSDWLVKILSHRFYMKDIHSCQTTNGAWRIDTALEYNINILKNIIYNQPYGMSRKYNKLRETFNDYNKDIQELDDGIVQTTT